MSAWDVDDLPDEFVEACEALVNDLPNMRKGAARVEEYMSKVRAEHPQYRKYKH